MPQIDYTPLGPDILCRNGKYNDYREISWHLLLAGDKSACSSFNITKSEIAFLKKVDAMSIRISRRYNIDSFFGVINILAVYTSGFLLAYNP